MFLEHRMRTIPGIFHMNPDYQHWHGWAGMKRDLAEIREEACPCQRLDRPQRTANSQGRQRVEGVAEQVRATDFMAAGTRGRSSSQGPESSRTSVDLGRKASFLCPRNILQAARRS